MHACLAEKRFSDPSPYGYIRGRATSPYSLPSSYLGQKTSIKYRPKPALDYQKVLKKKQICPFTYQLIAYAISLDFIRQNCTHRYSRPANPHFCGKMTILPSMLSARQFGYYDDCYDDDCGGLSAAAKAGIGVGVTVGALFLVGVVFCLIWRQRQRRKARANIYEIQDLGTGERRGVHGEEMFER